MLKSYLAVALLLLTLAGGASAETRKLDNNEVKRIRRNLLPLPQEITFEKAALLDPTDVKIVISEGASEQERYARDVLASRLAELSGAAPDGGSFEIVLGLIDDDGRCVGRKLNESAAGLSQLPNAEQAYLIQPADDGKSIILAAHHGPGLYYAAATMSQLLTRGGGNTLIVPLATVMDWPDIEERGMWNFSDPGEWIPWMSEMKLNYGKMVATDLQKIVRGHPNRAVIDRDLMLEARLMGFNYLPFIMHLNFLHAYGLFREYPETAGVGESALAGRYFAHKIGSQHRVPCAANPILTDILTEWMADIASQGADEVSCWLTERPAQCGHVECRETGQFVLEARAFVTAWKRVKADYPDFIIRLFISTTSNERYHEVLAETPPEVKLERCCSTELERVPDLPRDRFVNPLFDHSARNGRWVAQYDVPVGAFGRVETPEFKVPCSSAHRIRDYVTQLADRGYSGAYGMMGWGSVGMETCGFNIAALAEWGWNRNGRTTREFAEAWAARNGFADPDAVGEWSELMGPVEFDVYDSDFPVCWSWRKAFDMIDNRELPIPGRGMFRYFRSEDDFQRKIDACERALAIARRFDTPHLANETAVVLSYVKLVHSVHDIARMVAAEDLGSLEKQEELRAALKRLTDAAKENGDTIRTWRAALGPEPWHYRVHDAIEAVATTADDINRLVAGKYLY